MSADISVIVPFRNAGRWLAAALDSVLQQRVGNLRLEVSLFDDHSTDESDEIVQRYIGCFERRKVMCTYDWDRTSGRGGVGYAKNRAVLQSRGRYLCFLDADDEMLPDRIIRQYDAAKALPDLAIIGCKFIRQPEDSTPRYSRWANCLSVSSLYLQIYTSNGPTLPAPTWFCSRRLYDAVGGFAESTDPYPEDLHFYHQSIAIGSVMHRVEEHLVVYRYHPGCASLSIKECQIWDMQVQRFVQNVLIKWPKFTVWNAGKQGRRFLKSLPSWCQDRVTAFADVDSKKINQGTYEMYDADARRVVRAVPIVSVYCARAPFVIIKLNMTNGQLESIIEKKHLIEGKDYYFFG